MREKIIREPMPYGKVLVVDDMKSNLDVVKLLLTPYQLHIDTAESGFEALDIIQDIIKRNEEYDIIFMDHMMPEMNGVETVKKIRGMGYKQPIIALTASAATEGQREVFLANGFDGYISKPINKRQLNNSLNTFVRNKHSGKKAPEHILPHDQEKETDKETKLNIKTQEIIIPGVDTKKGLNLYDGNYAIYVSVLRSFIPNAITITDKMRNVSKKTLPDYLINVHGLKSICSNIGAEKLRKAASDLERKSKAGDLDGVLNRNEAIIGETETIAAGIKAWLETFDSQNPMEQLPAPDKKLLARLGKCCEAYDMDGIDEIMDKLEGISYKKDGSLITWLREKITNLDFAEAAERLADYEKELT